jgi:sugar (pentulose or hexulose) kinase
MGPVDETPLLLGIDVGTSEVKVVAVNAAGDTIRSAACAVSSTAWEPGFVEQQPEE